MEIVSCIYLDFNKVCSNDIETNISKYIYIKLLDGFYVCIVVDTNLLSEYMWNGFAHDLLIYGYDDIEKVYLCADYFSNTYEFKEIKIDKILNVLIEGSNIYI